MARTEHAHVNDIDIGMTNTKHIKYTWHQRAVRNVAHQLAALAHRTFIN